MNTTLTQLAVCFIVALGCFAAPQQAGTPRRGGLVLQFDDGWTSWRTLVAPELKRVGGRATVFVNNRYVRNGRITLDDLRCLQNEFQWEIGSHAYDHLSAVRFAQQNGVKAWTESQLVRAVSELKEAGLTVSDFVFPFNAYTPELARAVLDHGLGSYRRADPIALAAGLRADGSLPGTSIDLTRYLPLASLKQWVDMTHERGQVLFLYGHRVLPDEAFVVGRVKEVSAHELVADADVVLPQGDDVVLVPDMARRSKSDSIGMLSVAEGRRIRAPQTGPDLTQLTAPGASFLIGPAYGTRLSDFTNLISYASERLTFYTVAEIVAGKHQSAPATSGDLK